MRLAIADPPYLGRAVRWYGGGRGHFKTDGVLADVHPDAAEWDTPERHQQLVRDLCEQFDGWAVAGAPDTLATYLAVAPPDARVLVWNRANAMPDGARVKADWEFVLAQIPESRRGRSSGLATADVLTLGVAYSSGFVGSKPDGWTRWVLAVLGYDPATDTVDDLFPGSGRVAAAAGSVLL